MSKFIEKTKRLIKKIGKEVAWIGSEDREYQLKFDEFIKLDEVEYDSGYGCSEIVTDIVIVFVDGSYAERREYDGSEWWEYYDLIDPKLNLDRLKFNKLTSGCWSKLKELNE